MTTSLDKAMYAANADKSKMVADMADIQKKITPDNKMSTSALLETNINGLSVSDNNSLASDTAHSKQRKQANNMITTGVDTCINNSNSFLDKTTEKFNYKPKARTGKVECFMTGTETNNLISACSKIASMYKIGDSNVDDRIDNIMTNILNKRGISVNGHKGNKGKIASKGMSSQKLMIMVVCIITTCAFLCVIGGFCIKRQSCNSETINYASM